jgi:hypothetical protein
MTDDGRSGQAPAQNTGGKDALGSGNRYAIMRYVGVRRRRAQVVPTAVWCHA